VELSNAFKLDAEKRYYWEALRMPYSFSFDLSSLSRSFFREVAKSSGERNIHRRIGEKARRLIEKFRIREITGLDFSEALMIVEDLIDVHIKNLSNRESFLKTKKRALFLPHCSRKHMDNKCGARFNKEIPSYQCTHCSPDCLVNRATHVAEKKGYDVYVIPGSSCVAKILQRNRYEGIVGVACSEEIKLSEKYLKNLGIPGQAIPLIRNGCANTEFNIKSLEEIL
jgi:hypothetical protein